MKSQHVTAAILTAIYLAIGMSMVGCAAVRPQIAPLVAVSTHVERATAYANSAAASVAKSATSAAKAKGAIQAAQKDAQDIKDGHNAVESLQSHLALAQQVNEDTQKATESAKVELQQAKAESEQTATALVKLRLDTEVLAKKAAESDAFKAQAHENAKERDVVVWAFSFAFALAALSFLKPFIALAPTQYALILTVATFIVSMGAGYGIGRGVLFEVAKLLP